ncbi:3'-5' exonuclease [Micrococcus luteus]|uniref:3'-5' exonuclease n=1 Tax=Micrococcus luteus TaxID=1270 RepID=UPI0011AB47EF|nr:3'-5' exonuclease [Micrococcus luteus]
MPSIVLSHFDYPKDNRVKAKAFEFLAKLGKDDTLPGLHVEPIRGSADRRIRTGKVDDGYRAVMFKLTDKDAVSYVLLGVYEHDKGNRIAERATLTRNPINGVTEVRMTEAVRDALRADGPVAEPVEVPEATVPESVVPTPPTVPAAEPAAREEAAAMASSSSVLAGYGVTAEDLRSLGLDEDLAVAALQARDENAFLEVAHAAEVPWQGLALVDLGTGVSVEDVKAAFGLTQPVDDSGTEDEQLLRGLKHPAAQVSFAWIEDDEDLRRVIEGGDFAAWQLFLHPVQRQFVDRDYNGPAKLTGGAGTGKTVVLLHRTQRLAAENPGARILLTTYTRNLADALRRDLQRLDPDLPFAAHPGEPGVHVAGIDSLALAVARQAGSELQTVVQEVLGGGAVDLNRRTDARAWEDALAVAGGELDKEQRTPSFVEAEYAMVVLPQRITGRDGYLRAPRRGRGTALNRAARAKVWGVVEQYRRSAAAGGTLDFDEVAQVAAVHLERRAEQGAPALFDHVLVDEAQDLTPSRWQLLRALVAPGRNDLFIAEDNHQRIYGQKLVLSHYGIASRGRSRRLTLNYRTTQQVLGWAMQVLDGADFEDLDGLPEEHGEYRSVRSGPVPMVLPSASAADEYDAAADLLKSWLADEDVRPETVAVLVRTKSARDRVASALAERGVDIRAVDQEAVKPGAAVVMTMHRAKGTEFARVLLMDVREGAVPLSVRGAAASDADRADALLRERSLLYVAATRARDVLAVSWAGKRSSLLG